MKVCFVGDTFLGGQIVEAHLGQYLHSAAFFGADLRVANLEHPITDHDARVENKCTLYSTPTSLATASQMSLDAVALSNNHIQDKCDKGMTDTFQALRKAGIAFFGAGKTLNEAKAPYWIDEKTCVLGYCEADKPYLKKVQCASKDGAGVDTLTYERITEDLNGLPPDARAILHFHWGREHVALPEWDLIELARRLLDHEKVLCIIGMHAHRIQGVLKHNGKRAYVCLGNFLFPNFYIEPPTHITYPTEMPAKVMTTWDYHFVGKLTYKKWRLKNRISLMAVVDTQEGTIHHVPMLQMADVPVVKELFGIKRKAVLTLVRLYSLLFKLPKPIYVLLQKADVLWTKLCRYGYAFVFLARQNGPGWAAKNAIAYLNREG